MTIDVYALNARELNTLIASAERRMQHLLVRRTAVAVRRQMAKVARSEGYSIEELFGPSAQGSEPKVRRRSARELGKVAPKYRDPENKRNTWTGRGRMPRWLAERTKHGRSPTDFLIPGLGKPTAPKGSSIGKKSVIKQA